MGRRLEDRDPYVRHRVLDRLRETGGDLKAACAAPGMPDVATVRYWRRGDAAYDAAVRELMARGRMARLHAFDEARAAEIVRRLEAGETLRSVLADPRMPYWRCYRHWTRVQGHFGQACWLALRRQRRDVQARVHPPLKAWDAAVAEKVLLAVAKGTPVKRLTSAGLPGKRVIARWRREQPWFDAELRVLARLGPRIRSRHRERAAAPEVARRVGDGASLRAVGAEPGMPHVRTLSNWAKRGGPLAAGLREACDERDDELADEILAIAEGPGELADKQRRMAALYRRMENGRAGATRRTEPRPEFLREPRRRGPG